MGLPRSWDGSGERWPRAGRGGGAAAGPGLPRSAEMAGGGCGTGALPLGTVRARSVPARPPAERGVPFRRPRRARFVRRGGGCGSGGGSRPCPRRSGRRRRIRGPAARGRREGAGGGGCRCSRRPGGERRGDLGWCWARAKEGLEEVVRGRSGMGGGNVPEGPERGRRPLCWRDETPPGAGSVVVPAAGGNGRALWCLRSSSAGSRRPALSGASGADCKSLSLGNRARLGFFAEECF